MALRRVRRRQRASITSLIDVIFLLLLFFMLASTFSRFSEVGIASASSGPGEAGEKPVHVLTIGPDTLLLDQEEIGLNSLPMKLETIQRREADMSIAVEVTPSVTTQTLIDVLTVVRRVPGLQVHIMEPA